MVDLLDDFIEDPMLMELVMGSGRQKFPYVELSVILLKCRYAECCFAECCHAECCYAEYCYAECCYAECCYAECCHAECVTDSGIVFTALHFLRNLRISPIS